MRGGPTIGCYGRSIARRRAEALGLARRAPMRVILTSELFPYTWDLARAMIFVDGENLAIRYGAMLKEKKVSPRSDMVYVPNILAWSTSLNLQHGTPAVMRKYYYTSVQGDRVKVGEIEEKLKGVGIETPRVFKKTKDKGSKGVDITLTIDMLLHATRKHYDVAVLVAGDEDYVPLVRAVQCKAWVSGLHS